MKQTEKRKEYMKAYRKANREKLLSQMREYSKCRITHYVTYKHTNKSGDVYIGSGSNIRPYIKANRKKGNWMKAFSDGFEIEILKKFSNIDDARAYERQLINEIGLDNLVNQQYH